MAIAIERHVASGRILRIDRNRPSAPRLHAYVLASGSDLVLLHPFDDFEPDGYAVIRQRDIVALRSDEHERLWDRMLKGEGLRAGLEGAPAIDLSSMQAAIRSAASLFPFLAIECEDEHEAIEDFYFAQVIEFTGDAVRLRCVNGLAKWEPDVTVVPIDQITKVEFDTPYLQRFARYLDR